MSDFHFDNSNPPDKTPHIEVIDTSLENMPRGPKAEDAMSNLTSIDMSVDRFRTHDFDTLGWIMREAKATRERLQARGFVSRLPNLAVN